MEARPAFWGAHHAERFTDPSIIAAYRYRPPYSDTLLDVLAGLITEEPRTLLDVGCGPGNLARPLLRHVARVDAGNPGDHPALLDEPGLPALRLDRRIGAARPV
ncbi:MAG: hypothetical protein LC793_17130 [Thermomicrobia bacterium]|nr:hypothetical protein [Thermomicrobia bacterium]